MKKIINLAAAGLLATSGFLALNAQALAQIDYNYSSSYSTTDSGAGAVIIIIWLVICCCWLAIAGGLGYFVYRDAKKNNVENPVLWGVLTFLFGLIPLLIYFLAIKNKK